MCIIYTCVHPHTCDVVSRSFSLEFIDGIKVFGKWTFGILYNAETSTTKCLFHNFNHEIIFIKGHLH